MPCPFFQPTREVHEPTYRSGRLPLIDEYDGICRATEQPYPPDRETLFRCCNHGYSTGTCLRIPADAGRSSIRYSILGRTPVSLEIICVEETNYEPQRWHKFEYLVETAEVKSDELTECIRAQAIAFCRAYIRHFPA
jgi:hypothetical protein